MPDEYHQSRTCDACDAKETRLVSKVEAAFGDFSSWEDPCGSCGSTEFCSYFGATPSIDGELLNLWAASGDLVFSEQDEDMSLSRVKDHQLLWNVLLDETVLPDKRAIILLSMCVHVHDYLSPEYIDRAPVQERERARKLVTGLRKHPELFYLLGEDGMYDYIKEGVFPILGLPLDMDTGVDA